MPTTILRFGMLLILAALGVPAAAQTEHSFAAGVDSTGWAQAQSNADGHVLIESPQYPRGLWLHLVDDAGDALAGLQVEYQEQPDRLVSIRCVDPVGAMRETLIWTRLEADALRLTLQPKEGDDLPAGLSSIDWQIDPSVESLLEPVVEIRRIGWEAVAAFLQARWQNQAGRVAVQFNARTLAIEVDRLESVETLVAHLQQTPQPAEAALGVTNLLAMQVFAGNLGLQEGVILRVSWFDDPNLESVVREALGRPQGRLTAEDFASLTKLSADGREIRSLAGIEYFTALLALGLSTNQITDLTPINQLKNLNWLTLYHNEIVDLTPLSQLKNLQGLDLYDNRIVDLTPISQLNSLNELWLGYNQIEDLTPISQLKNLQRLSLAGNPIEDLTPLAELTSLELLNLAANRIEDVSPLAKLTSLTSLNLEANRIEDVSPLAKLTSLRYLNLEANRIEDVSPLAKLTSLTSLNLEANRIEDVSPLAKLTSLRYLNLGSNPLSDQALTEHIPALKARGVAVYYTSQ